MSVPFSGCITRSGGVVNSITKQLKLVNLKPVKKIVYKYDPFHENTKHIRDFSWYISSKKVINSNPKCIIKTEIVCDRSEPCVTFNLIDGQTFLFKADNLTTDELVKAVNKYITPLAPVEEVIEKPLQTKSSKPSKKKR